MQANRTEIYNLSIIIVCCVAAHRPLNAQSQPRAKLQSSVLSVSRADPSSDLSDLPRDQGETKSQNDHQKGLRYRTQGEARAPFPKGVLGGLVVFELGFSTEHQQWQNDHESSDGQNPSLANGSEDVQSFERPFITDFSVGYIPHFNEGHPPMVVTLTRRAPVVMDPHKNQIVLNPAMIKGQVLLTAKSRDINLRLGPSQHDDASLMVDFSSQRYGLITENSFAIGYRLVSFTGLSIDVLIPKRAFLGWNLIKNRTIIYMGARVDEDLYPILDRPVSKSLALNQVTEPPQLERDQTLLWNKSTVNVLVAGIRQALRPPIFMTLEAGVGRGSRVVKDSYGSMVMSEQGTAGLFAQLGIETWFLANP